MLDRLKIGTHITLFPEWVIEWEYRAMDGGVGIRRRRISAGQFTLCNKSDKELSNNRA